MFVLDCLFTTFLSIVFSYFVSILLSFASNNDDVERQSLSSHCTALNPVSNNEELRNDEFQTSSSHENSEVQEVNVNQVSTNVEQRYCKDKKEIKAADQGVVQSKEIEYDCVCMVEENLVIESLQKTKDDQASLEVETLEDKTNRIFEDEIDDEREGFLVEDDEGWEGIERTELEKRFGKAVQFVGCQRNAVSVSKLSSDTKMQLYGLHKVATEGHCHEPQPMAVKLSARAKWRAWKRFGNMSPELAMEQYIIFLSKNVPQWMEDDVTEDGRHGYSDTGICEKLDSENDRTKGLGAVLRDLL